MFTGVSLSVVRVLTGRYRARGVWHAEHVCRDKAGTRELDPSRISGSPSGRSAARVVAPGDDVGACLTPSGRPLSYPRRTLMVLACRNAAAEGQWC